MNWRKICIFLPFTLCIWHVVCLVLCCVPAFRWAPKGEIVAILGWRWHEKRRLASGLHSKEGWSRGAAWKCNILMGWQILAAFRRGFQSGCCSTSFLSPSHPLSLKVEVRHILNVSLPVLLLTSFCLPSAHKHQLLFQMPQSMQYRFSKCQLESIINASVFVSKPISCVCHTELNAK